MEPSSSDPLTDHSGGSLPSRVMGWLRTKRLMSYLLFGVVVSGCVFTYVVISSDVSSVTFLPSKLGGALDRTVVLLDPAESRLVKDSVALVEGQEASGRSPGSSLSRLHLLLKGQEKEPGESLASRVQFKLPVGGKVWRSLKSVMRDAETSAFPWAPVRERRVDCPKLFAGDPAEVTRANKLQEQSWPSLLPASITKAAANCSEFTQKFGFITSSLTEEERDFPIAYSILVFKDAHQVLDLLRAIYRPQNVHCIHVDNKTDEQFRTAMTSIAQCLPNIFLSSRSVDVRWGQFSVLEPEIICMQDLWRHQVVWKYLINLTGQEFPLRTNLELVQILKAYKGANNLEGTRKRSNPNRWAKASTAPAGIEPTKGSVHITVNRDFVDFILHTKEGQEFLGWARKVDVSDEVYFSSLNHNPHLGIRGAYKGDPETDPVTYPFLTRFKNWGGYPFDYPCAGKRVRLICVLSTGDLPLLDKRPELFANKFYADDSRFALSCLAERLFNHTRDEYLGNHEFNVSYYANMPFVKNQVTASTFNRTI